jgi:hypothetical protein
MTINPLKLAFTMDEFDQYLKKVNPKVFKEIGGSSTSPILGAVLHNTFLPDLKMVQGYLGTKKWSEAQLIENWWTMYRQKGWSAGPHVFVFPTKIYVATPLDTRGVHSPSYNKNYWGVEVVGDYSHEILPSNMRVMTERVMQAFYRQLNVKADDKNFHFHGEDKASSHHFCPGVNIGKKADWIKQINKG